MKITSRKYLWEILVPYHDNNGNKFDLAYHRQWDDKVRSIAGGLTIFKTSKGQWVSEDNEQFNDRMIPVRIYCSESQIDEIIEFTLEHYDQKAVLCYTISDFVKLVSRQN